MGLLLRDSPDFSNMLEDIEQTDGDYTLVNSGVNALHANTPQKKALAVIEDNLHKTAPIHLFPIGFGKNVLRKIYFSSDEKLVVVAN